MVAPEIQIGTRLQARVEAQEVKLESLSGQIKNLTTSVTSTKELLNDLPKSLEKMILGFQINKGKQHLPDLKSWEEHLSELKEKIAKVNKIKIGNPSASLSLPHLKKEEHEDDAIFTQRSEMDLARHEATAIIASGEHSDVMGKTSNYHSESKLNENYSPHCSTHQLIGPNSHTSQSPRSIIVSGHLPVKPYKPLKFTIVPYRHIKTHRHDFQEEGSYLNKSFREELLVPSIAPLVIDRPTQIYKPTCKIKASYMYKELAANSVENINSESTIHEFLSKSRNNHCSRSLGVIHSQYLKVVETLLCSGCLNETACVVCHSKLDFMKDDTSKAYGDLKVKNWTNQKMFGIAEWKSSTRGKKIILAPLDVENSGIRNPTLPIDENEYYFKINWMVVEKGDSSKGLIGLHVAGLKHATRRIGFPFECLYTLWELIPPKPPDHNIIMVSCSTSYIVVNVDRCHFLEQPSRRTKTRSLFMKKTKIHELTTSSDLKKSQKQCMPHVLPKLFVSTMNPYRTSCLWSRGERGDHITLLHYVLYHVSKAVVIAHNCVVCSWFSSGKVHGPIFINRYRSMNSVVIPIKAKETRSPKLHRYHAYVLDRDM